MSGSVGTPSQEGSPEMEAEREALIGSLESVLTHGQAAPRVDYDRVRAHVAALAAVVVSSPATPAEEEMAVISWELPSGIGIRDRFVTAIEAASPATPNGQEEEPYDDAQAWKDNYDGLFTRWAECDAERVALKEQVRSLELRLRIAAVDADAALASPASPAETREGREALARMARKAAQKAAREGWESTGFTLSACVDAALDAYLAAASPAAVPLPEETGAWEDEAAYIERACQVMHDAYEDAAHLNGWESQVGAIPWAEVPEANKATMRSAVSALLFWHEASRTATAPSLPGERAGGQR